MSQKKTSSPETATAHEKSIPTPGPPQPQRHAQKPSLRFSPTAWAKLLFFRDRDETEIGGFGITDPDDLLYVEDFATVKQTVTAASVAFEDEAVGGFFDAQVDAGRKPEQFARIWCHTHPGNSPEPSGTDEDTFARVFGGCDWAIMLIVSRFGRTFARLRFNVGPAGETEIPVEVDYSMAFPASNHKAWEAEYTANVQIEERTRSWRLNDVGDDGTAFADYLVSDDLMAELEAMDPEERRQVLVEFTGQVAACEDEELF